VARPGGGEVGSGPRRFGGFAGLQARRPGLVVVLTFAAAIVLLTLALWLPASAEEGRGTTFVQALFTATSAICVTGLAVVDTPAHWSELGEGLIIAGVQFGGLGFMTSASLLGLGAARRLGLRTRILAATETRALGLGDVRRVVRGVAVTSFAVEGILAVVLGLRFWVGYDMPAGRAAYEGLFHAVMAFNNAGFALYPDNLVRYATDPLICLPIAVAVIMGALGFPVLFELRRELSSPRTWSLHTKITVSTYALLLVAGTVAIAGFEWHNPRTIGPLGVLDKLLVSFFMGGPQTRSAGFNSVDVGAMNETSWLVTDCLMFIGGGSAGMGGGIKVTTFMLLFFAIVAEVRGDPAVSAFGREISGAVVRQALSVALLGVALVVAGTLLVLALSGLNLDRVLFEVVSAFSTNGLSTGITGVLPPSAQYVLVGLMFAGRLGPITVASALALRESRKLFRLPEERPIVG
jgi:Trk-type K+ transport system membrane component